MKVSRERFDAALAKMLDESPASHLLSVPGVYEALSEEFNNAVLDRLAEEFYCEECGELIDNAGVGCVNPDCDQCRRCIECNTPLTDRGDCPNAGCPARP